VIATWRGCDWRSWMSRLRWREDVRGVHRVEDARAGWEWIEDSDREGREKVADHGAQEIGLTEESDFGCNIGEGVVDSRL